MSATRILLNSRLSLAVGVLAIGASTLVGAHESGDASAVFLGLGVQSLQSDQVWPADRLPGILEAGNKREDERGDGLAYVEVGANVLWGETHQLLLSIGSHGEENEWDAEAAWFGGALDDSGHYRYRLGRQMMPIGGLNRQEMHGWSIGVAPITMRAVLGDSLRADGLALTAGRNRYVTVGTWKVDAFPGAPNDSLNSASMTAGWWNDSWDASLSFVSFDVDGRALSTVDASRHTHTLPSCSEVNAERVCFVGQAKVLNGALSYEGERTWIGTEVYYKQDSGYLDSIYGTPDYLGEFFGAWLEAGWQLAERWQLWGRLEQGVAGHTLVGSNLNLIADQVGISQSDSPYRSTNVALNWRPWDGHFFSIEGGRYTWLSDQYDVYLLRYQFDFDYMLSK